MFLNSFNYFRAIAIIYIVSAHTYWVAGWEKKPLLYERFISIMVADGTNFNPVVPSGDVTLTNAGVFGIASGVIVNADINASAAIADSKLDTISTANKVGLAALDIDGGTDIGADIVDADLFIIDYCFC